MLATAPQALADRDSTGIRRHVSCRAAIRNAVSALAGEAGRRATLGDGVGRAVFGIRPVGLARAFRRSPARARWRAAATRFVWSMNPNTRMVGGTGS